MRIKIILLTLLIAITTAANGQTATDTIYNPPVTYQGVPRTYEIAGIKVTGAPNYDDMLIIGYSGLRIGDRIEVPGNDVTSAIKRLMRQGLFSQAQIKVEKIHDRKIWLEIALRTLPRISAVNYYGMKKSEREDIEKALQLMKGNVITRNIVNLANDIVNQYNEKKSFG
ncbi:MAG: outer membrane protein assembly factor BamA, partial [Muribaculaceae bacterium]|nr:outer membrane protein assembly factor BamA [Muribaculaceae bacterium]